MPHRIRKGKGKRWQKGQSSSSNPTTKKHRNQAQRGLFNYSNERNSNLTSDVLAKHNAIQGEAEPSNESDIDGKSEVSRQTFATIWSECTNPCFSRLLKKWDSGSEFHKEMLAILAAVTEVIKSKDGKETEAEYFAALMTTLSTVESVESLSAVVSLLHMAIKRLSKSVLKVKFSEIAKEFVEILNDHADSDNGLLLRSLIGCIGHLLKCQELATWSLSSTLQIFQQILSFTVHSKPKVRKSAHNAVCSSLKGSDIVLNEEETGDRVSGRTHPAASVTAKFCIEMIKQNIGSKDATMLLHILQLLKDVLATFPQSYIKNCCESVLSVMKTGESLARMCSFQALLGMFSCNVTSSNLSSQLNAKIINALYDFQPSANDYEPLIAWLCVMKEAHSNLYRLDSNLTLSHLPNLFNTAINCFLSEKVAVHRVVFDCLKMLMTECMIPHASEFGLEMKLDKEIYFATKILVPLENGLKYQFHVAWSFILNLFSTYFEIFARHCHKVMTKVLPSLADLRDSYKFSYTQELDHAIGMAIKTMGPQIFLQYVPLQLQCNATLSEDFARSWLLPVLRDNIQETELSFFVKYFVPLAKNLQVEGEKLKAANKIVEHKTSEIIQTQIWSLLPGFCNKPTDLHVNFKLLARLLGDILKERTGLRIIILTSLRHLIKSADQTVEDQGEMAKYAKNYIPIFFNLYCAPAQNPGSVEEGIRLAVYETLKVYLLIADDELIATFFDVAFSKAEQAFDDFTRSSLLDLMRAMLFKVDEEKLLKLYNLCVPLLQSADFTIQKKAYRILEEICGCGSDGAKAFTSANISLLQDTLISSLSKAAPSSRAPRLRCLNLLVRKLDSLNMDLVQEIIPEAILCTKYGSEKSKRAAFDLIATIGEVMLKWGHKSKPDILKDFIKIVLLGLQGSQQMVSASILALCAVIHQFKEHIDSGLLDILISNVCQLMSVPSREIVKSALSFIKVLFSILSDNQLAQYLPSLMEALLNMTDDTRQHFRLKVKEILDRLTRKFGFEIISKMIPEKYEKVLKNIRKLQARKAKKKILVDSEKQDAQDDHSVKKSATDIDEILQDSDTDDDHGASQNNKSKNAAWIQETSTNQIVDFLDPKSNRNVTTTDPSTSKSSKSTNIFEKSSDGRWIITGSMDDSAKDLNTSKGTKRKAEASVSDEEDEDLEPPLKKSQYKSGGKGIHRPLKNAKTEEVKSTKTKKSGPGDAKKGKYDPFVYVPLERAALNKRKEKKMKGRFKNLVDGAKKGSTKGKRQRNRFARK